MLAVNTKLNWDGRPYSELQRLMALRTKQLRQTAQDATVASAITVLRSLKPLTRIYKGRKVEVARG